MSVLKVGNLYHIGVAVKDAEKTSKLYVNTLGLKIEHDEVVMDQGVRAIMMVPENGQSSAIELLEPVIPESPINKFLDNKGEGMHHVCDLVNDIKMGMFTNGVLFWFCSNVGLFIRYVDNSLYGVYQVYKEKK